MGSHQCVISTQVEKKWRKISKCQVFPTHSRFQMINHKLSRKNTVSGFHSTFHTQTNPTEDHNTISLMVARSYLRCLVPFESKIYCIMFFNDQEKNEKKKTSIM